MKNETFEEKLAYSKELLEKLMQPDITLEDSVKLYEEGLKTVITSYSIHYTKLYEKLHLMSWH